MQHTTEMAMAPAQPVPFQQPEARRGELQIFERVTSALLSTLDRPHTDTSVIEALNDNRRLWQALESDVSSEHNLLPDELKAKIISVALWVERHSQLASTGKARLEALISVNQAIMKGLAA
jgi:flagellar protein FlaF